jgi:hypothetical protein
MSSSYTVLPLLGIGGLLITLGGALGPETRDVDMGGVGTTESADEREPRFMREPAEAPAGTTSREEERVR